MGSFFLYSVCSVLIVIFLRGLAGVWPSGEWELKRTWHGWEAESVGGGDGEENGDDEVRTDPIDGLAPERHVEKAGRVVVFKRRVEARGSAMLATIGDVQPGFLANGHKFRDVVSFENCSGRM